MIALRVKESTHCKTHRKGKPWKKVPRQSRRRESGEAKGRPSHKLMPTLAKPTLAILIEPILTKTDFGQTDFGQINLAKPTLTKIGVSVFWLFFLKKKQQDEKTKHGRTNTRRVGPRRWGSPNFCTFFPLLPPFSLFLSLSGVFSWNFGGV